MQLPGVSDTTFVHDAALSLVACLMGALGAIAVFRSRFAVYDTMREAFRREVEQTHQAFRREVEQAREHDQKMIEMEIKSLRDELRKRCDDDDRRYKDIERRQIVALELTANIARKNGIKHRALGSDSLTQFLVDDEPS